MNTLRLAVLAATAAAATITSAQDLQTEITVERTVIPAERAATRLQGVAPSVLAPQLKDITLYPAEYTRQAAVTPDFMPLDAAPYPMAGTLSPWRGYAELGYFPAYNLGASAGYRIVDRHDTRVGAWMQFDGATWHHWDQLFRDNTLTLGAEAHHRFGAKSQISVEADYTRDWLRAPMPWDTMGNGHYNQGINHGGGKLSWWSRAGRFGYHVSASWRGFGFTEREPGEVLPPLRFSTEVLTGFPAVKEGVTEIKAGFASRAGRRDVWGVELSGALQHWSGGSNFMGYNVENEGIFSVMPYYNFRSGKFAGRLGLGIEFANGDLNLARMFAPQIRVAWTPFAVASIYANVDGGHRFNTLQSLYDYTPFITSAQKLGKSRVAFDGVVGVNVGPAAGVTFDFHIGYASVDDWAMPYTVSAASEKYTGWMQQDLSAVHGGMSLQYAYKNYGSISVGVDFADNNTGYYMWRDRAEWVVKAGLVVTPISRLRVEADYELRTDRSALLCTEIFSMRNLYRAPLENASNLSVGASYELTPQLTVKARVENIGGQYDLLYNVWSKPLNGLVGVSYKF